MIYVVMGEAGYYSSKEEWPVLAFESEEGAERHARSATEHLKRIQASRFSWECPACGETGLGALANHVEGLVKCDKGKPPQNDADPFMWSHANPCALDEVSYSVLKVPSAYPSESPLAKLQQLLKNHQYRVQSQHASELDSLRGFLSAVEHLLQTAEVPWELVLMQRTGRLALDQRRGNRSREVRLSPETTETLRTALFEYEEPADAVTAAVRVLRSRIELKLLAEVTRGGDAYVRLGRASEELRELLEVLELDRPEAGGDQA
ncbi:MAG: hypothetical protein GWN84_08455 [Gammaproteobacteria bacterium]|nr:hypothetical protein [Gammaproteobacteria bacterium]NIR82899.1 hypothetical protein [Gammaproteobacteria bacterium]NIR90167.1 hypothetical protein [Gammaproteobacteria bacterium]NIU03726.1 hypothetical protein [Gammaproteobacteria bacterium]NIV51369.1 hypothetical protein [Gammaproteobacteria bacterium]